MSDNTQLNAGSGGDIIRNKDRSGIKTQIVALDLNPAGSESLMAGSIPVTSADTIGTTAALNAQDATASVAIAGKNGVTVTFGSGSLSGTTIVAEVSYDGGATWNGGTLRNTGFILPEQPSSVSQSLISPAASSYYIVFGGPATHARVRVSVYGSGTVNATLRATTSLPYIYLFASDATNKTVALIANSLGALTVDTGASIVPGTGATHLGKAEDAAHTSGDTGIMALGVREASPTDLSANAADGDYEPFQFSSRGGLWVAGQAGPRGGWDQATGSIGATKTDIGTANTRGQVGGWFIYNPNTTVVYVQFFNTQASGVTLGTTPPVYSLGIPPSSAANIAPGMVGLEHVTAICIAVTTTRAGLTGPASTVDYNIWFKQ